MTTQGALRRRSRRREYRQRSRRNVTRLNDIDCDVKSAARGEEEEEEAGNRGGVGGCRQMWGEARSCEESVDRRARHSRMQTLIKHTTNRLATTSSCAQLTGEVAESRLGVAKCHLAVAALEARHL